MLEMKLGTKTCLRVICHFSAVNDEKNKGFQMMHQRIARSLSVVQKIVACLPNASKNSNG